MKAHNFNDEKKIVVDKLAKELSSMRSEKVYKTDIEKVLLCQFNPALIGEVYNTRLYTKQGGAYCVLLEILYRYKSTNQLKALYDMYVLFYRA